MLAYLLQQVNDSGPIYRETIMGRFPVEPFNTASNFVFLASIIYFSILIYRSEKKHWFLRCCMPLFFAGFVGGTIYHATRSDEFWLLLDWVPIVLLCVSCACYFVFRAQTRLWEKLLLVALIIGLNVVPRMLPIPVGYRTSMGYVGTAIAVVLPILLYGYGNQWRYFKYIVFAIASFLLAVSFRTLDKKYELAFLYMGTHWLWHTLGGVAVFFLMRYIYLDNEKNNARLIK